jgi:hypothetical protein
MHGITWWGLDFSSEDGDSMFFRHVGIYLQDHSVATKETFTTMRTTTCSYGVEFLVASRNKEGRWTHHRKRRQETVRTQDLLSEPIWYDLACSDVRHSSQETHNGRLNCQEPLQLLQNITVSTGTRHWTNPVLSHDKPSPSVSHNLLLRPTLLLLSYTIIIIILPSMPTSHKWSHLLRFCDQNCVRISHLPIRVTSSAHLTCSLIWPYALIVNYRVKSTLCSPPSEDHIFTSELFRNTLTVFLFYGERPSFTPIQNNRYIYCANYNF